jgi:hypothetical protein
MELYFNVRPRDVFVKYYLNPAFVTNLIEFIAENLTLRHFLVKHLSPYETSACNKKRRLINLRITLTYHALMVHY